MKVLYIAIYTKKFVDNINNSFFRLKFRFIFINIFYKLNNKYFLLNINLYKKYILQPI